MSAAGPEGLSPRAGEDASLPFGRVAIVGLGVMGGSLARALKALERPPYVVGYSPERAERDAALASGALDEAPANDELAVGDADLIVYAAPLGAILELEARHAGVWQPHAVISDLSSLKVPLAAQARALGVHARYVGAHPMVGDERSGFGAARGDLFRGAVVWLSARDVPAATTDRVERFWRVLGARPQWIDAVRHDERMAHASHLPQVLANVLARYLEERGFTRAELGSGGRDMTRLAGSSPEMWRDLLRQSAPLLAPALREVGADLEALAVLLEAGDIDGVARMMRRTRDWARGEAGIAPEEGGGDGGAQSSGDMGAHPAGEARA